MIKVESVGLQCGPASAALGLPFISVIYSTATFSYGVAETPHEL